MSNKPKNQFELTMLQKGLIAVCPICQKQFRKKNYNQKYCCLKCREALKRERSKFRREMGILYMEKSEVEKLKLKQKFKNEMCGANEYG